MTSARYGIAIMREQIELTGIWLLIRLGLKHVTPEERYKLIVRQDFIKQCAERFKK
jgi:hypothetical protein